MDRVMHGENFVAQEVNVIFVNNAMMKKIHREYFQDYSVTDVISFRFNTGKNIDGEIYVCLDQSRRQAQFYKQTFTQETSRLILHGTLHLIGYDDATTKQRAAMKAKEDFYLQEFKKN